MTISCGVQADTSALIWRQAKKSVLCVTWEMCGIILYEAAVAAEMWTIPQFSNDIIHLKQR